MCLHVSAPAQAARTLPTARCTSSWARARMEQGGGGQSVRCDSEGEEEEEEEGKGEEECSRRLV
eukprot:686746-Rhodomonas_salina.1